MPKIEGLRIKNFRALRDITLGKRWNLQKAKPLTPLTAVIGKNGVGKSTLFDAFGFLADCLRHGVEEACDLHGRGGFQRLRSLGSDGPIEFEIYYRSHANARPITYELTLAADRIGRPFVQNERLRQRRKGQQHGRPYSFLLLNEGRGEVWRGDAEGRAIDEDQEKQGLDAILNSSSDPATEESSERDVVELDDVRKLGIATLGSLRQHPRIAEFRKFIEGWYLSYFSPDAARSLPLAGPQKHLNSRGNNLGNVVQFFEREHGDRFQSVLKKIAGRIPGIHRIDTETTTDGRLLLRFNDQGFKDPFLAQQMSDGTLKVFSYLLLLEDPSPPPFLCIEEPENGLYHRLLETLAREFREHATGRRGTSQIFVTTHQPYFVDALTPEETWILEKGDDGFSTIRRASENPEIVHFVEEGLTLGSLWYSDYLDH